MFAFLVFFVFLKDEMLVLTVSVVCVCVFGSPDLWEGCYFV